MDARLKRLIKLLAVAVLVASAPARAQLADPTRPPNAPTDSTPEAGPAGTALQSVLISQGRRLAIINGNTVGVGGMVGEAKVVKITETEVVLDKGGETEVLKLFPGIDKQPVKRRTVAKSGQGRP
jgi:MSHA biogenesis protein MshK